MPFYEQTRTVKIAFGFGDDAEHVLIECIGWEFSFDHLPIPKGVSTIVNLPTITSVVFYGAHNGGKVEILRMVNPYMQNWIITPLDPSTGKGEGNYRYIPDASSDADDDDD